jgi:hypothetical protein
MQDTDRVKPKYWKKKRVLVSPRPPQLQRGVFLAQTRAAALRAQRLTN